MPDTEIDLNDEHFNGVCPACGQKSHYRDKSKYPAEAVLWYMRNGESWDGCPEDLLEKFDMWLIDQIPDA